MSDTMYVKGDNGLFKNPHLDMQNYITLKSGALVSIIEKKIILENVDNAYTVSWIKVCTFSEDTGYVDGACQYF